MATLRKDRNPSFECCEADYFIAFRDGKPVGRVAAIINRRANEQWKVKQVRFGWFDFIDDLEVSRALLDEVARWGRERGMTEMVGPLGFIDTDREGMLMEGFGEISTMYVNYNYPYYGDHISRLGGFEKDNDYLEYKIRVPEGNDNKFHHVAEIVKARYGLRIHKFTHKELLEGGYGHKVFEILNITYAHLYGFSQLSEKQVNMLVSSYIKMADLNLVPAVMDGDELVGFAVTFPALGRALQKTRDGRLFPFGWFHLLRALRTHNTDTADLMLIGVLPAYRSKGATALIFDDLIQQFQRYGFKWADAMPMMERNRQVLAQWDYFDEAAVHRRHRCFRKLI
jgi:GNAT superfamily N-acetyltransferase